MAFIFPEDKADFTAPNGVIYHWDGTKWVVKAFRSTEGFIVDVGDDPPDNPKEGDLWYDTKADELTLYLYTGVEWVPAAPPVSLDGINATIDAALVVQNDLLDRVQAGEVGQKDLLDRVEAGEIEQRKIELAVEELQVTKGSVARYKITATNIGAAGRNGELYVNNAVAADVQAMSFAPFDLNGQPIRPCNVGDIVELVEAVALRNVGEVCRYRILSGDSNALTVEYLSGTNDFVVDETQEVYIYPQNEAGASKDYVDSQVQLQDDKKLNLSGGTLTNSLRFNKGNKASPQFNIEPNSSNSDTNIYVFNDGQMRLRSSHTDSIDDRVGSHIVLDPNGGAPETKIYHVVTPTAPTMAANKEYVDAHSGGGAPGPASLRWTWRNYDSTLTPGEGKAAWYSHSQFFRLSFITADGINIGKNHPGFIDHSFNPKLYGSCWYKDGEDWRLKQLFDIYRIQYSREGCMWIYRNSIIIGADGGFTNDVKYHFTVSGFF